LIQLLKAHRVSSGCWIGITTCKQNRRQAILEIEKTEKNSFQVYGFCKKKDKHEIGYGTGRYILDAGFTHVENNLTRYSIDDSKELDDDIIFEPLWERGVNGLLLTEPIFDIGSPENWLYTLQHFRLVSKS
jgi:hypothetical protein